MMRTFLRSRIHGATVTEANVDYRVKTLEEGEQNLRWEA